MKGWIDNLTAHSDGDLEISEQAHIVCDGPDGVNRFPLHDHACRLIRSRGTSLTLACSGVCMKMGGRGPVICTEPQSWEDWDSWDGGRTLEQRRQICPRCGWTARQAT